MSWSVTPTKRNEFTSIGWIYTQNKSEIRRSYSKSPVLTHHTNNDEVQDTN